MYTYEKGVVIVKSVSERVDFEGKHEQEEAGKRMYRNEQMRLSQIKEKIHDMTPVSKNDRGSFYKLSDSCYVFSSNYGVLIVGNSPDISDYMKLEGDRVLPVADSSYIQREVQRERPEAGIYIKYDIYGSTITHEVRDEWRPIVGAVIRSDGRGEIVDYTKMKIGAGYTILQQPETIDISDRPTSDTMYDIIQESILDEEGRTAEESSTKRVLKNDYAGILEQMDVEVEHIPDEEIRAVEMSRRLDSVIAENDQLSARNEAIVGRAKEEISALRAEVERLKAELETSREETKSEKRDKESILATLTEIVEKLQGVKLPVSPKKIAELLKTKILDSERAEPNAPDASDNGEDR